MTAPRPHQWWCCEDCTHDGQDCPAPEPKTKEELQFFQSIVKITGCKHQASTHTPAQERIDAVIYQLEVMRDASTSPDESTYRVGLSDAIALLQAGRK